MKTLLIIGLILCACSMKADLFDCDCPSGSTDTTSIVVIRYMGTNYNVNVTYCYKRYNPRAILACDPAYQDYSIVIKKICPPIGSGIPLNDLIKGTIMAFDVCCANLFNSTLNAVNPIWCYTFAIPQCWEQVATCWQPCAGSDCCLAAYRWEYISEFEPCKRTLTTVCSPDITCATGCTEWNCDFPTTCPCY